MMTTPREWVQIGLLAHVVDGERDRNGDIATKCGAMTMNNVEEDGLPRSALCAACYEADRREK